jgi:hypothetical protein
MPGVLDAFTPSVLEFKEFYLTFGDLVGRVLMITDFPPQVKPAWLSRLFNMPGVLGSLHILPTDADQLVQQINKAIHDFSARLVAGSNNALVTQRTEQNLRDAQTLLRKIDSEQQAVFSVIGLLMVTAKTKEDLDKSSRRVEAAAAALGLRVRTLKFQQKDGLTASSPFGLLPEMVKEVAPRHMPSETVAGAFPFIGGSVNHNQGILLGRDANSGLVIIDRWDPPADAAITNPNMTVLATSGAGKSFAVKLMLLREYMLGAKVIILDPEREYKDLCAQLGGIWINAAGGGGRINPLQIRPIPKDSDESSDGGEASILQRPLAQHMQRLRTFFALYLRELSDLERASLEDALITVYDLFGIGWDTDPEGVKVWPTVKDLHAYAAGQVEWDRARWERLSILLRAAGEGTDASLWAGQSAVEGDAGFVVIDVHDLQHAEDSTKRAQYFNVLTFAWDIVRRDRSERKMLVVDEAWLLADPKVPQALDFLRDMSKRIRKYSGSLTIISQNAVDFLAPEVARQGEAVLGNASMKLLLRQGEKDLQVLPRLLSLSEAEQNLLANAKRGEALLVAGNQRVRVFIEAAPHELVMVDPKQAASHGLVFRGD